MRSLERDARDVDPARADRRQAGGEAVEAQLVAVGAQAGALEREVARARPLLERRGASHVAPRQLEGDRARRDLGARREVGRERLRVALDGEHDVERAPTTAERDLTGVEPERVEDPGRHEAQRELDGIVALPRRHVVGAQVQLDLGRERGHDGAILPVDSHVFGASRLEEDARELLGLRGRARGGLGLTRPRHERRERRHAPVGLAPQPHLEVVDGEAVDDDLRQLPPRDLEVGSPEARERLARPERRQLDAFEDDLAREDPQARRPDRAREPEHLARDPVDRRLERESEEQPHEDQGQHRAERPALEPRPPRPGDASRARERGLGRGQDPIARRPGAGPVVRRGLDGRDGRQRDARAVVLHRRRQDEGRSGAALADRIAVVLARRRQNEG